MAFMKIAECTFHKFRMKSLLTIDEGLDGGGAVWYSLFIEI